MEQRTSIQVLADNLRFLREQLGYEGQPLTQTDVAKRCGVSQRFVSNIQAAAVENPSTTLVSKLGDGLGVGWRIYDPELPNYYNEIRNIERLGEYFGRSNEEGRETILRVAESVSIYKP